MGKSKKRKYDAFLIYPHEHIQFVRKIAEKLEDIYKLTVWFSEWRLPAGANIIEQTRKGLDESKTCVLFLSSGEPKGHYKPEYEKAHRRRDNDKNFPIIPVLLEDTDIDYWKENVPLQGCIDFKNGDWEQELERLAFAIMRKPPGRRIKSGKIKIEPLSSFHQLLLAILIQIQDLRRLHLEIVVQF